MNQKTDLHAGVVRDVICAAGLASLCSGVAAEYGWPWALIVGGGLVVTIALIGAIRGAGP